MSRKLYLIPNMLNADNGPELLPASIGPAIAHVRTFMVEDERAARRLLKKLSGQFPLQECTFFELSEHAVPEEAKSFFLTHKGADIGIISEAGLPCVADPGADIVRLAHTHGVEVIPLTGPSSIFLALMASGLNGQNFAFNGYLPKDKPGRIKMIKELDKRSRSQQQTQIIMETPYRNNGLLEDLLAVCSSDTLLCVAVNIGAVDQSIRTQPVSVWRKARAVIPKSPALFLISHP